MTRQLRCLDRRNSPVATPRNPPSSPFELLNPDSLLEALQNPRGPSSFPAGTFAGASTHLVSTVKAGCAGDMAQIRGTAGYNLGGQDRFGGAGRADATNDPSPLEQIREQTSKIEEWLDNAADPIKPCVHSHKTMDFECWGGWKWIESWGSLQTANEEICQFHDIT